MTLHYNGIDDGSSELMHYGVLGMKWHHRKAVSYAAMYNRAKTRGNTEAMKRYNDKYNRHINKNVENGSPSKYNRVTKEELRRHGKAGQRALAAAVISGTAAAVVGKNVYESRKRQRAQESIRSTINDFRNSVNRGGSAPRHTTVEHTTHRAKTPNDYAERIKRTQDRLKEYQEAVNRATNGTTNKKRRR